MEGHIVLLAQREKAWKLREFWETQGHQVISLSSLEAFWGKAIDEVNPPILGVVDVSLMSDGQSTLHNLNVLKEGQIPLVFLCHEDYRPLLRSIDSFPNLGVFVFQDSVIGTEEQKFWDRIARLLQREDLKRQEILHLRHELKEMKKTMSDFHRERLAYKTYGQWKSLEEKLLFQFGSQGQNFYQSLEEFLHGEPSIERYSLLISSSDGRSLYSPILKSHKFFRAETITLLEKLGSNPTKELSQSLGQIFDHLLQKTNMMVHLGGNGTEHVFLSLVPQGLPLDVIPWKKLSWILNQYLRGSHIEKNRPQKGKLVPAFEFMSMVDDYFYKLKVGHMALLVWDYSHVVKEYFASAEKIQGIFWKSFFQDQLDKIDYDCFETLLIGDLSPWALAFLVESEDSSLLIQNSKEVMKDIVEHRYVLRPSDEVNLKFLKPQIYSVPVSSLALLRGIIDRMNSDGDKAMDEFFNRPLQDQDLL